MHLRLLSHFTDYIFKFITIPVKIGTDGRHVIN